MAAQQAFPPTPVGTCELKTLPAGTLLRTGHAGDYFTDAGGLFMPLFRYISSHKIDMTTPVEAQVEPATMSFWVAPSERARATSSEGAVAVVDVAARPVASVGGRGGYTREHFEEGRERLLAWLRGRTDVEAAGPAYAVYWDGPFTPWFAKRYEVHIPVRVRAPGSQGLSSASAP